MSYSKDFQRYWLDKRMWTRSFQALMTKISESDSVQIPNAEFFGYNYHGTFSTSTTEPVAKTSQNQPPVPTNEYVCKFDLDCSGKATAHLDRTYHKRHTSARFSNWCFGLPLEWEEYRSLLSLRSGISLQIMKIQAQIICILAATGFRKFSYLELKRARRGFRVEIGRGAGGFVYKATLSKIEVRRSRNWKIPTKEKWNFSQKWAP